MGNVKELLEIIAEMEPLLSVYPDELAEKILNARGKNAFKFYTYCQNNSGGYYDGPHYVIVEAISRDEADIIAEDNGVYFDGCSSGRDCNCCGDRWSRYSEESDVPEIYGDTDLWKSSYNYKIVYK